MNTLVFPVGALEPVTVNLLRDDYRERMQVPCVGCGEHQLLDQALLLTRPWRLYLCERCAFLNLEIRITCRNGHSFTVLSDQVWEKRTMKELSRLFHCACNLGAKETVARRR